MEYVKNMLICANWKSTIELQPKIVFVYFVE